MQKLNRTEMAIPMRSRAGHSPLPLPPVPQPLKGFQPMSDAPPPIPPEQQEARLQGVMTISHYLESLGEPGWRGVLLQWLGRYDGIEVYMFPEEDPVLAVQELLGAYVEQGKSLDPEEFSAELADLHFCHYRARRDSDRKKWEPLADHDHRHQRGHRREHREPPRPGRQHGERLGLIGGAESAGHILERQVSG